MKRRWRVVLLRAKGEILGTVDAPDAEAAKAAAAWLDSLWRPRRTGCAVSAWPPLHCA